MKRRLLTFALACILIAFPFVSKVPVFATESSIMTSPASSGSWKDYSVREENRIWYTSGSKTITISDPEQFIYLCQMAESDTFEGWTFYVTCDLDLGNYWFKPIGAGNEDFRGKLIGAKDGISNNPITVRNLFVSSNGISAFIGTANGVTLQNFNFVYSNTKSTKKNFLKKQHIGLPMPKKF